MQRVMVQHVCVHATELEEVDLDPAEAEAHADDGTSAFHRPFIHYTWRFFRAGSSVRAFPLQGRVKGTGRSVNTAGKNATSLPDGNRIDQGVLQGRRALGISATHLPIKKPRPAG